MSARGLRLNNPGNVRLGLKWQGMADVQADSEFITFKTPEDGIRAMAKVLMTYKSKYKITTLEVAISRYAPASENDTDAYVDDVSQTSGISPDSTIDLTDGLTLSKVLPAIIKHENGSQPYTVKQIALGVSKALTK